MKPHWHTALRLSSPKHAVSVHHTHTLPCKPHLATLLSCHRCQNLKTVWDAHNGRLNPVQFCTAITVEVVGKGMLEEDIKDAAMNLFMAMDRNHDGMVDWSDFCDHVRLS